MNDSDRASCASCGKRIDLSIRIEGIDFFYDTDGVDTFVICQPCYDREN